MAQWAIGLSAVAAVVFAVLMVAQRSLYASAVCLLAVLLQTAVFFFFFGAPMLAFLQVMIYAGAVMVLVVVTIMASPGPVVKDERWGELSIAWPVAAAGLLLPVLELIALVMRSGLPGGLVGGGALAQYRIGTVLFGPYAVATEAVGLLLFLSALAIVRPRNGQGPSR